MGGFCGGGKKSDTDRAVSEAVNDGGTKTYTGGIKDDLTMGLSTIGLTGEAQAAKLSEMGYSSGAIEDYQYRTAETKKRNAPPPPSDDNDKPAPAPAPAPAPEPEPEPEPEIETPIEDLVPQAPEPEPEPITPTPEPDPGAEDGGPGLTEGEGAPEEPDTGAGTTTAEAGKEEAEILREVAQGPAEAAVAETVEAGRRETILTTPQGLTTKAKTRRKRSMISGEELEEGLLN